MLPLDEIAYRNRWRPRHPGEKAVLSLGLLACAVALPPWPGAALAGGCALVALLGPAGLAPAQLWRAMRVPLAFVLTGTLPMLVSVGGPHGIAWDPAGPATAANVVGRAVGALLCLLLFAATTPMADVLPRLERLGVPAAVTEIAALTYRLLFLLLDTARGVREAQAARLGFSGWRTSIRSVAGQGGAIFVQAFDRARRLEEGLALRGYSGSLRVEIEDRPVSRAFVAGALAVVGAVVGLTLVATGWYR
jgi:cobalt/nickel transport system permease protein